MGPQGPRPRRWWAPSRVFIYTVLIVAALFYLFPLYVVIITSLKTSNEIRFGSLFDLPLAPTGAAWIEAWDRKCIGLVCEGIKVGFWNSVKITVPSVALSIFTGSVCGYVLVVWRYRGAEFFFLLLLFCMFIPPPVILYPLAQLIGFLNLMDTLWAIIAINTVVALPFLALLFRNGFAALPADLYRAARVDGAGFWRIYAQVLMPQLKPLIAVALMLQVTFAWSDFMFTAIFAGVNYVSMTILYHNLVGSQYGVVDYNVQMAATVLTGAVPLVVYFLCGPLFMRGLVAGATAPRPR